MAPGRAEIPPAGGDPPRSRLCLWHSLCGADSEPRITPRVWRLVCDLDLGQLCGRASGRRDLRRGGASQGAAVDGPGTRRILPVWLSAELPAVALAAGAPVLSGGMLGRASGDLADVSLGDCRKPLALTRR